MALHEHRVDGMVYVCGTIFVTGLAGRMNNQGSSHRAHVVANGWSIEAGVRVLAEPDTTSRHDLLEVFAGNKWHLRHNGFPLLASYRHL